MSTISKISNIVLVRQNPNTIEVRIINQTSNNPNIIEVRTINANSKRNSKKSIGIPIKIGTINVSHTRSTTRSVHEVNEHKIDSITHIY